MNELEKTSPEQELATPEAAAEAVVTPEITEEVVTVEVTEETADDAQKNNRNWHAMAKDELLEALKNIVETDDMTAHKDVAGIKQAFYVIRQRETEEELQAFVDAGNQLEAFSATPDTLEAQFKDLLQAFKEKRGDFLAAEEARKAENLEFRRKILAQLHNLAEDIDNINLHVTKFQQLQSDFKEIKDIPEGAENETWKDYQGVVEQFYDRLKMNIELRDLHFKKNLEMKRALIDEARKLQDEADVVAAFRKLQDLHSQWREIGPVAKELREEIWAEFKELSTAINKRHQEHFENRKAQETANEEAKTAICEEIEAIDLDSINSFNAWDEATKKVLDMQARWKGIGFASRKNNNALFSRFRTACDAFFTRKAEYFKKTKDEFAANLAKKEELCRRAEELKGTEDLKKAIETIVELQNEWKKVGSVARKHSDAIWQRFTAACNYFFDLRKKQTSEVRKEENANLAAKREIIAKLKEIPTDTAREDAIGQIKELQAAWQAVGHVPFRLKDKLYGEYREALDNLFKAFDYRESRARISNFGDRLNEMKGDDSKLNRERDRLFRQYEQKKTELKTYENNLGFFNVKSNAGNNMLAEMERKIRKIKDEIYSLEEKINMIDSAAAES